MQIFKRVNSFFYLCLCRFKRTEDRGPIEEVMAVFLPILHSRCTSLIKDDSAESSLLLTKVFKIFRGLIQVMSDTFNHLYPGNVRHIQSLVSR